MLPKWVTKDKISAKSPSKSINSVAVVGLGTMGSTIAVAFLQIGEKKIKFTILHKWIQSCLTKKQHQNFTKWQLCIVFE